MARWAGVAAAAWLALLFARLPAASQADSAPAAGGAGVNQDDAHRFVAVGAPFRAENYGIAFPLGSDLGHKVNRALLRLSEDGTYDPIAERWFGKSSAQR